MHMTSVLKNLQKKYFINIFHMYASKGLNIKWIKWQQITFWYSQNKWETRSVQGQIPPPPPLLKKCHIDNDVTLTLVIDFRSEARHTLRYVTDNLCAKYEHLIFLLIKVIDQTWKSDKLTDRYVWTDWKGQKGRWFYYTRSYYYSNISLCNNAGNLILKRFKCSHLNNKNQNDDQK